MKNRFIPLLLLFGFSQNLFAQFSPCPTPPPPGTGNCANTCVYCNLDGYTGINDTFHTQGPVIYCGVIAVQNDRWFGFEAGSAEIEFTVNTNNCQNGDGLQTAIFDNCSDPDALICSPGLPGGAGFPLPIAYDSFTIGEIYYLVIDGWSGDICHFEIQVTKGTLGSGQSVGSVSVPDGPAKVCPGTAKVYSIPAVANAGYYLWTAPPGASINGQGESLQIDASLGASVTVTFGNESGAICVEAGSACSASSSTACLEIVCQSIPNTVLPALRFCAEELPYFWAHPPFIILNAPGTYHLVSLPYTTANGCDSLVEQLIVVRPELNTNLGTQYLCNGDCFSMGGTLFCDPGTYSLSLVSADGCDSLVNFTLANYDANAAEIQTPLGKTITCDQPTLTLQSASLPNVAHQWKNSAGGLVGTSNTITVNSPSTYTHTVTAANGALGCVAEAKVLIKENTVPPPVTASGGTINAQNPTVKLMGNSIISGVTYAWNGPNGFSSSKQNPVVSAPGFYTLTVTHPQTGCSNSITVEVTGLN